MLTVSHSIAVSLFALIGSQFYILSFDINIAKPRFTKGDKDVRISPTWFFFSWLPVLI